MQILCRGGRHPADEVSDASRALPVPIGGTTGERVDQTAELTEVSAQARLGITVRRAQSGLAVGGRTDHPRIPEARNHGGTDIVEQHRRRSDGAVYDANPAQFPHRLDQGCRRGDEFPRAESASRTQRSRQADSEAGKDQARSPVRRCADIAKAKQVR